MNKMEDKYFNFEGNIIELYYFKLIDNCNKILILDFIGYFKIVES